jgi:hypothetical protein
MPLNEPGSGPGPLISNANMLLVTDRAADESAVMQLCLTGVSLMPRSVRLANISFILMARTKGWLTTVLGL